MKPPRFDWLRCPECGRLKPLCWLRQPRTGTVACECGWFQTQRWWLPGFTTPKILRLIRQHRFEKHERSPLR